MPASRDVALIAAPILFLIAFFTVLIGRALGVALRNHPHTSGIIAFLSIVVLLVGAGMVLVIAAQRIPELMLARAPHRTAAVRPRLLGVPRRDADRDALVGTLAGLDDGGPPG